MIRKYICLLLLAALILTLTPSHIIEAQDDIPIHPEFPVNPENLSPPIVHRPIYACAMVVHISGFIPHATVEVYANGSEKVGEDTPHFGFGDIKMTRPLVVGDEITAIQIVNGVSSGPTVHPVIVEDPPSDLTTPDVGKTLYECGHVVPTGNLTESTTVHVLSNSSEIGQASVARTWQPVITTPLIAAEGVTAYQVSCEGDPRLENRSAESSPPVTILSAPKPMLPPVFEQSSVVVGGDAIVLTGLYVGAEVAVYDNGTRIGGGYATADANWVPLGATIQATSQLTATQTLCDESPPSDPVEPATEIRAPVVVEPICEGAQYVMLEETVINAFVVVFSNGSIVAYGGGTGGSLILALGAGQTLNSGDQVEAVQYIGMVLSPFSNTVTVQRAGEGFYTKLTGDEKFFIAEEGEQQIDAPVYPRGGNWPHITILTCCGEEVEARAEVYDMNGNLVTELVLTQPIPGYFVGDWKWNSDAGWAIPDEIPVGQYTVVVSTTCGEATLPFYVIFNPAEVSGLARFSFNETNVWYYVGNNSTYATLFHLHSDDNRIFSLAMKAAAGQTDALTAAQLISDLEESLFKYSISVSHFDSIQLLNDPSNLAQCADDAAMLVAMLRSMGVPSHTTTIDSARETGAASWGFDTWTEFLVPYNGGPTWMVLHPHEYPNMSAETQRDFGDEPFTYSVATNVVGDLVVIANEGWVWNAASDYNADVRFDRSCGQPVNPLKFIAPWTSDISFQYWDQPFWWCARGGAGGAGLMFIEIDREGLVYSGRLSGTVFITNPLDESATVYLTLEFGSDLPETMSTTDDRYARVVETVELEAGGTAEIPFAFDVPAGMPIGSIPYLAASLDGLIVPESDRVPPSIVEFFDLPTNIQPDFEIRDVNGETRFRSEEISRGWDGLNIGDEYLIVATVVNTGERAVDGIEASLTLPPGLVMEERESPISLESLAAGESLEVTWPVRVVAPLEAGTITIAFNSENGGWSRLGLPVRVNAPSDEITSPTVR